MKTIHAMSLAALLSLSIAGNARAEIYEYGFHAKVHEVEASQGWAQTPVEVGDELYLYYKIDSEAVHSQDPDDKKPHGTYYHDPLTYVSLALWSPPQGIFSSYYNASSGSFKDSSSIASGNIGYRVHALPTEVQSEGWDYNPDIINVRFLEGFEGGADTLFPLVVGLDDLEGQDGEIVIRFVKTSGPGPVVFVKAKVEQIIHAPGGREEASLMERRY